MSLFYLLFISFVLGWLQYGIEFYWRRSTGFLFSNKDVVFVVSTIGGILAFTMIVLIVWSCISWSWWKPPVLFIAASLVTGVLYGAFKGLLNALAPASIVVIQIACFVFMGFSFSKL